MANLRADRDLARQALNSTESQTGRTQYEPERLALQTTDLTRTDPRLALGRLGLIADDEPPVGRAAEVALAMVAELAIRDWAGRPLGRGAQTRTTSFGTMRRWR